MQILQYLIIALVVAACVAYAAIRIFQTVKKSKDCTRYGCFGCAFYDKCEENKKKVAEKFGGTK